MVLLMRLCRCIVVMVACGVCFRLVGAHACMYVLLAVPEKLSYPDEGLSWTSSDRYGRVLSFTVIVFNYTVTGTTI